MSRDEHPLFLDRYSLTPRTGVSLVVANLIVAACYGLTGYAGLKLAIVSGAVTLFWPPSGIAFAVVWMGGIRLAPGVALGAFAVNLASLRSPEAAALLAVGNTLPSVVARTWIQRIIDMHRERGGLGELERAALFIILAGLVCTMISATFGTVAISTVADLEPMSARTWFIWWMGDAAGVIVIAPPLLLWRRLLAVRPSSLQIAEAAALTLALAALVTAFGLVVEPIWAVELCKLLGLLTVMVAAVRFGLTGAALSLLFIASGAISVTLSGNGPFLRGGHVSSYALLHSYLLVVAVAGALLAAALADLHRLVSISRRTSQLALEADMAKSRLLAAASHDLRQPIHALKLSLEVLSRDLVDRGAPKALEHARLAARSAGDMLEALLDFSRTEAGRFVPQNRRFALQTVFANLEAELGPQADYKRLIYRTRDTPAHVVADPILVELILRNLISNALRYTERGGVLVAARLRADHVIVEVHDTGIGIEVKNHSMIFNEFFQVKNEEKGRIDEGHGLGLAIASRFAKELGTEIEVRSRLGLGSKFSFRLNRHN